MKSKEISIHRSFILATSLCHWMISHQLKNFISFCNFDFQSNGHRYLVSLLLVLRGSSKVVHHYSLALWASNSYVNTNLISNISVGSGNRVGSSRSSLFPEKIGACGCFRTLTQAKFANLKTFDCNALISYSYNISMDKCKKSLSFAVENYENSPPADVMHKTVSGKIFIINWTVKLRPTTPSHAP